jgi:hypothetical protein
VSKSAEIQKDAAFTANAAGAPAIPASTPPAARAGDNLQVEGQAEQRVGHRGGTGREQEQDERDPAGPGAGRRDRLAQPEVAEAGKVAQDAHRPQGVRAGKMAH